VADGDSKNKPRHLPAPFAAHPRFSKSIGSDRVKRTPGPENSHGAKGGGVRVCTDVFGFPRHETGGVV
jgi:hypothetical protein